MNARKISESNYYCSSRCRHHQREIEKKNFLIFISRKTREKGKYGWWYEKKKY